MNNANIVTTRKQLCRQLATIAKSKGVSQLTIATELSVAQGKVSRWFSGEVSPHLDNFLKLCAAVGVEYVLKEKKIKSK